MHLRVGGEGLGRPEEGLWSGPEPGPNIRGVDTERCVTNRGLKRRQQNTHD